ncbi:hypothetical protein COT08_01660 [Candidatus Woesebacteria bacterium CG07_land_8_20_14_0_80_44_9]|uniref:Uncharacterized protein n=3 Tax=Candidatus Woeseibacteriota TaxID=1752722 RepID=A0A2H0BJV6_9BACT|nr:MAG: hypothetical protein COX04_00180 [Candidatus Woesebacteria bacterium CG22_combo_CG10-13_8_21_14_all_45_10]PIU28303.1 MAG: hypothetical protein COT08_01660 [Candidatus Woesebacteria bacterium CG07_land_8_20_14_0_80_44_9]PIZ46409.1 MAG: hypothetical protein COY30_00200 [Candidatus Woesebacteria bacterium CG_4_10_14_0_2_um_filter_44_9]
MAVPKFLQPYLASYDLAKLDAKDLNVSREIITKVLNLGDIKAVGWVFENYTLAKIREVVKNPQRGVWNEESLNYWKNILKVDEIDNYDKAIMNIYPQ